MPPYFPEAYGSRLEWVSFIWIMVRVSSDTNTVPPSGVMPAVALKLNKKVRKSEGIRCIIVITPCFGQTCSINHKTIQRPILAGIIPSFREGISCYSVGNELLAFSVYLLDICCLPMVVIWYRKTVL
jgi:hypothetical protein